MIHSLLVIALMHGAGLVRADDKEERIQYLRPAQGRWEPECVFTIRRAADGREIRSETGRGATRMLVTARYDVRESLVHAEGVLHMGDMKQTVVVEASQGKAHIKPSAGDAKEVEVPAGVIVTSAPDWTDTFLLCRNFDRTKGGQQEFPGLWIHPTQPSARRTFKIEHLSADAIEHENRKIELDRYRIELRPGSQYIAWADGKGRMIRLVPLPYKEGTVTGLVLEGFEKAAASLKPRP